MSRLTRHELYKIIGRRGVLLIFLALVSANILITIMAAKNETNPESYKTLHVELEILSAEEALSRTEIADDDFLDYSNYTLYRLVQNELLEYGNYGNYLHQIQAAAKKLEQSSIFSNMSGYSYKNIVKTAEDFQTMTGVTPIFAPSLGIKLATSGLHTDILVLLALFVVSFLLFTYERERGLLPLSRTTPNGMAIHGISKLFSTWIVCVAMIATFYIPKIAIGTALFGLGDLSRPIQSVYGFSGGILHINVLQYLLCYCAIKLFMLMTISAIFCAMSALSVKPIHCFAIATIFISGSYLLGLIPSWHPLSIFAVIEPLSWLKSDEILTKYLNINILGFPVRRLSLTVISMAIALCGTGFLSVIFYFKQRKMISDSKATSKKRFKPIKRARLLGNEVYKLLIVNRALLVFIVFIAATMYIYAAFPIKERFADLDAMGYKRIAITYEGIVQEDRPIFEEIARMNLPDSILSEIMRQHLDYLQTKEESQLLYDAGYKQLTFGDIRMELWLFLIAVILLIAILGGFAAMEYRSGAIVLMRSSAKGYKKVIRAKLFIAIIAAFFVCLLVYIPQIYGVLYSYGMPVPSAPAYSMEHLWFLPQTMTIFRAITASMCLRLIILIAFAVLLLELSKLAKNVIQAYLLCSGVLILPILLALVLT